MFEFKRITDTNLFDQYVISHPLCHYQKTSTWGKYRVNYQGDEDYLLLVAMENNQIIASAMTLITRRKVIGKVAYIPTGFCVDYYNTQLVNQFTQFIKQQVKPYGVTCIKIDPTVKRVTHDIEGHVIDGENNEAVTQSLIDMGYTHRGYGYAYDGSWNNRFTLIAPIGIDNYEKTVQKSLIQQSSRQLKTGLTVRDGTDEDLDAFVSFAQTLGEHKSFTANSKSYFKNYIDANKPYSIFKVVEIDYDLRASIYQQELQSKPVQKDANRKASVEKKLNETLAVIQSGLHKEILGGAIYMGTGHTLYDPYTYTDKEKTIFKAAASLHLEVSREYRPLGYQYLDFVGFAGNTDVNDPYYGLYDFKSKFGSEFVEYIGEFDYIINPVRYYSNKCARQIKHILKTH